MLDLRNYIPTVYCIAKENDVDLLVAMTMFYRCIMEGIEFPGCHEPAGYAPEYADKNGVSLIDKETRLDAYRQCEDIRITTNKMNLELADAFARKDYDKMIKLVKYEIDV